MTHNEIELMQTFLDKESNSLTTVLNATPKNCVFDNNEEDDDDDDDDNDDELDEIANHTKIRPNLTGNSTSQLKPQQTIAPMKQTNGPNKMDAYQEEDDDDDEENDGNNSVSSNISGVSNESEKLDLLTKLDTLRANGHVVKNFSLNSPLLEMKKENHRLQHSIELNRSIKFQQKMLMAVVSALEYGNKRFDPFKMDLDGWSENIFENVDDFNHCFERLFEKYRKRGEMAPELELLLTLAGSAFMFNMSNQLFKSMNQPLRNIRNTVRSAFQQRQNNTQQQTQPTQQQQQPTSLQDLGSSFLSSMFGGSQVTQQPMQSSLNPDINVRNTQLENFRNSLSTNANYETEDHDILDQDRFSVASSSNDSIIEPHVSVYNTVTSKQSAKLKTKTPKNKPLSKQTTQRTIVI